jgi:predicted metal-dependent peptidase
VGPDGTITIYVPSTPDDHSVWGGKPTKIDELSTSAWLEEFKKKAGENPKWGQGLGDVLRRIEEFLKPKVRWQPILKRFVGQAIRVGHEATRKRPSRRLGWDAPGKKTVRSGRVLFAIDNSGSISALEIGQFFGEIASLVGQVEIIVAIWDTAIRQVVKIENKGDLRRLAEGIGGGGGTYIFPVFEGIKDPRQISDMKARALFSNLQALVVLTDGDLEWPGPEWDILPTLWGITKESNVTAPKFGIPLYLNLLDG